jgi:hypothetical protein
MYINVHVHPQVAKYERACTEMARVLINKGHLNKNLVSTLKQDVIGFV